MCVPAFPYVPNNVPPTFPPHFIFTSHRLSNFCFLCDHFLKLKNANALTVVIVNEDLFVWRFNLH